MTREEIKKAMRDTKREIVIKNLHKLLSLVEGYPEYEDCISYAIEELEQESTTKNDLGVREFEGIDVTYPPEELCTYPEYKGKPYFGIKYKENGEEIVGYGTYNPKVLSQYLKDYFILTTNNNLGVDCISREQAIKQCGFGMTSLLIADNLRKLPPVAPQSRKGHWEHGRELSRVFIGDALRGINYEDWHCSNCHCVIEQSIKPKWNYCPNCGADMREVEV